MSVKLNKFIEAVNIEFKKAEKIYKETKESAEEIAASAAASPSQSGDRYHSQGTADLAKQKYDSILALKKELEVKGERIIIEHQGQTLFLVDNSVIISGFKIASTNSPFGQKILNGK